jgi:hypothetical protein
MINHNQITPNYIEMCSQLRGELNNVKEGNYAIGDKVHHNGITKTIVDIDISEGGVVYQAICFIDDCSSHTFIEQFEEDIFWVPDIKSLLLMSCDYSTEQNKEPMVLVFRRLFNNYSIIMDDLNNEDSFNFDCLESYFLNIFAQEKLKMYWDTADLVWRHENSNS